MGFNHLSQLEEKDFDTLDRRDRYKARAILQAQTDPGPWLSSTILPDSRKRATKNNWGFDIDRDFLVTLWHKQEGRCAVSRLSMQAQSGTREDKNPYRASLDRIDNAKSTWDDDVFESFINSIVESRK